MMSLIANFYIITFHNKSTEVFSTVRVRAEFHNKSLCKEKLEHDECLSAKTDKAACHFGPGV